MTRRHLTLSLLLCLIGVGGCQSGNHVASSSSASPVYKVYKVRGKVVASNPSTGEVTLDSEKIPGFMEAMVMPYKLKDPSIASELHPGDVITADVLVSQGEDAGVLLDNIDVVAQGKPDYRPTSVYHVPAPGDVVPDFTLRNQDGQSIHLHQYRGRALLITFIYTRCPLPNFCPLVTHNFALIEKRLRQEPAVLAKTELLSISFDPEHDTPARLRAYGDDYMNTSAKDPFAYWNFAVPQKSTLDAMARYFDVGITTAPDGAITHTLSTTLIGRDGKVIRFYPGNEWSVDQVFSDVKQAASGA